MPLSVLGRPLIVVGGCGGRNPSVHVTHFLCGDVGRRREAGSRGGGEEGGVPVPRGDEQVPEPAELPHGCQRVLHARGPHRRRALGRARGGREGRQRRLDRAHLPEHCVRHAVERLQLALLTVGGELEQQLARGSGAAQAGGGGRHVGRGQRVQVDRADEHKGRRVGLAQRRRGPLYQ
eukprot:scaffold17254_cov99-Isochrysis_galbana.AAC.3